MTHSLMLRQKDDEVALRREGQGVQGNRVTLESLGVKQQCLHCCGEVRLGGHGNMLTHSEHRHKECVCDNFPAKLHVNIWRIQLMRMDSYRA